MATKLTKAELTQLASDNDVDISQAKTNADIEQALNDAGVDTSSSSNSGSDANNNVADGVSDSLANEARELGIEPASYTSSKELQERVDHVRAEKEATAGDTSMTEARAAQQQERDASRAADRTGNANLNSATDAEADDLKSSDQ